MSSARRPLRILVVTNMYPPHHYGGYELSCRDVMTRLRDRGHDVTVLTSDVRRGGVSERREVGVRRELRMYWDDHRLVSPPMIDRLRIERHNQRRLRAAIDEVAPDVVSVWNMAGLSLGMLTTLATTGLPLLLAVCNDWLVFGPDLDAWTRVFRRRPALRTLAQPISRAVGVPVRLPDLEQLGTYCFVSSATRRWAEEHAHLRFPDSTVVFSGIDPGDFPLAPDTGARPWRWRLLYVGRIAPEKGVETAVRALARLPEEATLALVGPADDEERRRLEQVARDIGVASRLAWRERPRAELREEYLAADALVFPSLWEEPFGLVPVEAMACRTPVVATGAGGSAEFLGDGRNALLFPKGDDEALARALRRLAADDELRGALTAAGADVAVELTVDRLAGCFESWHVAVANRFAEGRPADRVLTVTGSGSASADGVP